jgi:hypothetical protein
MVVGICKKYSVVNSEMLSASSSKTIISRRRRKKKAAVLRLTPHRLAAVRAVEPETECSIRRSYL